MIDHYVMLKKEKDQQFEENTLRSLREELGMTQHDLSTFLGISLPTISRCETGRSELRLSFNQWLKFSSLIEHRLGIRMQDLAPMMLSGQQVGGFFSSVTKKRR